VATLQVSGERVRLVDDTHLLIAVVLIAKVGGIVNDMLVVMLLGIQRW
jgi:hypothetical protein